MGIQRTVRALCCAIGFFLIHPIQCSSTTLRHRQTSDDENPNENYSNPNSPLSPPSATPLEVPYSSSDDQLMSEIIHRISRSSGFADSQLFTRDDGASTATTDAIDEILRQRELDGRFERNKKKTNNNNNNNNKKKNNAKKKKKKKKKKKNKKNNKANNATPAPTNPFEPVDDLSIPDKLNRCLLGVLPNRTETAENRRRKKKQKSGNKITTSTDRNLQHPQQGQGFDYMATNELQSFLRNYNNYEDIARDDEVDFDDNYDREDDDYQYDTELYDFLYDDEDENDGDDDDDYFDGDDSLSDNRRLQIVQDGWDRGAINSCLLEWQNDFWVAIICVPPTSEPSETPTLAPTCDQNDVPICLPDLICVPDELTIPCTPEEQLIDPSCDQCPCQCASEPTATPTFAPTCDQDDIPICLPDIVCDENEIVYPCTEEQLINDPTCNNCPCQCIGGKGKGKGKGKGVEDGKGKGKGVEEYVGKGHHKPSYYGKGKPKGSKGSKGGYSSYYGYYGYYDWAALENIPIYDARVVKIVRKGICVGSSSPTRTPSEFPSPAPSNIPTGGPSSTPTNFPTPRPTPTPSVLFRTPAPSRPEITLSPSRRQSAAPTCDQFDVPICLPEIICEENEIVYPCTEEELINDPTCNNCPCQCLGGKGKGKGKGKGVVEEHDGEGKGVYDGKGEYHKPKPTPPYHGKGKGRRPYWGKGYKGSKAKLKKRKNAKIASANVLESGYPSFSPQEYDELSNIVEAQLDFDDEETNGLELYGDSQRRKRKKKPTDNVETEEELLLRYLRQAAYDEEEWTAAGMESQESNALD